MIYYPQNIHVIVCYRLFRFGLNKYTHVGRIRQRNKLFKKYDVILKKADYLTQLKTIQYFNA